MTERSKYIVSYQIDHATQLVRTSVSLDTGTLGVLDSLAKRWAISKAEVMRRATHRMKEEVEADIEAERQAKRYWRES